MSFRFADPLAFQWLWLVPITIFLGLYLVKKSRGRIKSVLGERLTPFLTSSVSNTRRRWKIFLEALVVVFFVLALARPQVGESEDEIKSEGVEIIVAVDVSTSMLAEDVKPSRLEFAKKEISRILSGLSGDKVGIVAFAGSAALLSPMSTDKAALRMFVDSLSPESVSTQGTEFRKALLESQEAFKRGGADTEDEKTAVTRVVLIVSDGEDNEPGALETAKKLRKEGIRVFSLAFGTEDGAPIPIRDSNGKNRGFKRDRSGKTILSQTKGTVLRELAKVGDGSFYHATFGGTAPQNILDDIGRLEQAQFESQVVTNYGERYQIFLLLGFIFALIEFFLGERSPGGRLWKGRFEVSER